MNFWDPFCVNFHFRVIVGVFQNGAAAFVQLGKELHKIDSLKRWSVFVEVTATTVVELLSAACIPVSEMMQANCRLDQSLVESPRGTDVFLPKLLPHFVGLKKLALIEEPNSFQVTWVVSVSHATIIAQSA
jgi:hypothetical protein